MLFRSGKEYADQIIPQSKQGKYGAFTRSSINSLSVRALQTSGCTFLHLYLPHIISNFIYNVSVTFLHFHLLKLLCAVYVYFDSGILKIRSNIIYRYTYTHTHTYIYMYIYIHVYIIHYSAILHYRSCVRFQPIFEM